MTDCNGMSFEQAMESLQTVLEEMERGSLTLEQSIAAYEKAVQLIKRCRQLLEDGQRRIEVLRADAEGVTAEQIRDEFAQ
ncbi:MAG: exodeoxyribonuclease VII small subunit [Firmicutes bacterium]|nr:exodeoxyribonuclease VII small subunit [Bacillota bacterium]